MTDCLPLTTAQPALPFEPGFKPAPEETYPDRAGWTEPSTSREAAERIDAETLRGEVLACLRAHGPMTPDECAARLGKSVLAIRPRFTELKLLGAIQWRGDERRPNASGRSARVCEVTV